MPEADIADVAFAVVIAFALHYNKLGKWWRNGILAGCFAIIVISLVVHLVQLVNLLR